MKYKLLDIKLDYLKWTKYCYYYNKFYFAVTSRYFNHIFFVNKQPLKLITTVFIILHAKYFSFMSLFVNHISLRVKGKLIYGLICHE